MSIVNQILDYKKTLDKNATPLDGREYTIGVRNLYLLLAELRSDLAATDTRRLDDCIQALIHKNWVIVRASMPKELYGIRLKFNVPFELEL